MQLIQDLVHKLEVGGGMRHLRIVLAVLAALGVTVIYNVRSFKNFGTREAMDTAQLARNLAEGRGYTTQFIRPFSIYLLRKHQIKEPGSADLSKSADTTFLRENHPDLANPPAYPFALSGLLKILPIDYAMPQNTPFWTSGGLFRRYPADFFISFFNQLLFFGFVVGAFFLTRRLFEARVAWLSTVLLFGSELYWRFSVSGLSTIFLLLILLGLAWCLVALEAEGRAETPSFMRMILLAIGAGAAVGLGALTRYSVAWLILPVAIYLAVVGGRARIAAPAAALVVFALLFLPWIVRNYSVCGEPFGIASYTLAEGWAYPGDKLQRSLDPELNYQVLYSAGLKLCSNLKPILTHDLPNLGGGWISAFFIVGLLVPFRDAGARRFRYFVLASLVVLILAQALGRSVLSEESPEITSENLLVLMAPFALIYGASLFFMVLDQIELPAHELRLAAICLFSLVVSLPMIFTFLPPRGSPMSFPPYYPPQIQGLDAWANDGDLVVSDVPWAVAWYCKRQCLWITTDGPSDLVEINDFQKPVKVLFLSPHILNTRLHSEWITGINGAWTDLVVQAMLANASATGDSARWPKNVSFSVRGPGGSRVTFPLHYWQGGWPQQFLVTAIPGTPKKTEY